MIRGLSYDRIMATGYGRQLIEIENISSELAEVSQATTQRLTGEEVLISDEELMKKLSFLETGEHGVVLAVVPGLRDLLIDQ